ncbi:MAG: hypothetical protein JKY44_01240 [Flavobacteriaceae bacterium]|nr:hypothetical protein [Flavobacteriaceae bacterium]
MAKKNTVSLKTAQKWIKEWRDLESSYNKYHRIKAFNIPLIDLQEVLKEKGIANVRAYLGVAKFENHDTNPPEFLYEEKLLIVGVDKNNKDMISVIKAPDGLTDGEGDDIYDLTSPCPDLCDPESPLND